MPRRLREDYRYIGKVFLLGCFSGYPQIFVFSLLTLWLKSAGVSKTAIGAIGMVTIFYAFNWLFAPLADRYRGFTLDRRRFWMLGSQALMLLAGGFLWRVDIRTQLDWAVIGVLLMAFASALQDVSIDALRIELAPPERNDLLTIGASWAVVGWNSGFYLGAALGLHVFGALHGADVDALLWPRVYGLLSLGFVVMMALTWYLYRPDEAKTPQPEVDGRAEKWYKTVLVRPFAAFVARHGLRTFVLVIAFVFLFKLGEAFLGRMAMVFYKEIGFSEMEIANYVKIVGWVVVSLFSLVSGLIALRFGLWRGLMIGGIAMAATNLLYALLAWTGPNVALLLVTVICDQFTSAFATVSFVTFISALCDRRYTASQYALFASVGNGARILLASSSGYVLEHWLREDWALFFVLTTVMVVPGLVLLWMIHARSLLPDVGHHALKR